MLLSTPKRSFQNHIEGSWGRFSSPGGDVAFLMTKARLGQGGTDAERRLTSHLRPVREILETDALNFNQLLQRDLDDHRVATELIPYVLAPQRTGPAFFPPVVAVLLPFRANRVADRFPDASAPAVIDSPYGAPFEVVRHGSAFESGRLWDADGAAPHPLQLGRLSWNDEEAKLVVIDGQHRAMALLAVDRTLNKTWGDSSGAKYRYFYEHRVRALLDDDRRDVKLEDVEFPVTICWFPEAAAPHTAARKLFVDLNKEARAPSEARLILLSDDELSNIFARGLLNALRDEANDGLLPIYAVEYDNPDARTYQPVRWSVLTNLHLLRYAVLHTVFCPVKYADDMGTTFGGRLPWEEMNEQMREALDVGSLMPETVDDGDRVVDRADVSDNLFPRSVVPALLSRFLESWGTGILHILSDLLPYRDHWKALQEIGDGWIRNNSIADLAYEALFAGVGMYWTLRDSHEYYRQQAQDARDRGDLAPDKPEIVEAWEALEDKREAFESRRAARYVGSTTDANVRKCNAAYGVFNTHACQLGALLTYTTLARDNGVQNEALPAFAQTLARAWNEALGSAVNASRDRRLVFSKDISKPLNQITKMDTPLAVHFRYFWLELLCLPEAAPPLEDVVDVEALQRRRDQARATYYHYLVREQVKALRRSHPEWASEKVERTARKNALKTFTGALKHWFNTEIETVETWYQSAIGNAAPAPSAEAGSSPDTPPDDEPVEAPPEDENEALLRTLLG